MSLQLQFALYLVMEAAAMCLQQQGKSLRRETGEVEAQGCRRVLIQAMGRVNGAQLHSNGHELPFKASPFTI